MNNLSKIHQVLVRQNTILFVDTESNIWIADNSRNNMKCYRVGIVLNENESVQSFFAQSRDKCIYIHTNHKRLFLINEFESELYSDETTVQRNYSIVDEDWPVLDSLVVNPYTEGVSSETDTSYTCVSDNQKDNTSYNHYHSDYDSECCSECCSDVANNYDSDCGSYCRGDFGNNGYDSDCGSETNYPSLSSRRNSLSMFDELYESAGMINNNLEHELVPFTNESTNTRKYPILNVDEVTCISGFVIFKSGDKNYLFTSKVSSSFAKLKYLLGTNYSFDYNSIIEIVFPNEIDSIVYTDNFLYVHSNNIHTVIYGGKEEIECGFFKCANIDHTNIHYCQISNDIFVHVGRDMYKLIGRSNKLLKIIEDRHIYLTDTGLPIIQASNGDLVDYLIEKSIAEYHPWFSNIVHVGYVYKLSGSAMAIFVDIDDPSLTDLSNECILINIHHHRYIISTNGFVMENKNVQDKSKILFHSNDKYNTDSDSKLKIINNLYLGLYELDNFDEPIVNVFTDNKSKYITSVIIKTESNYYHLYRLMMNLRLNELSINADSFIDESLIRYQQNTFVSKFKAKIEIGASKLRQLCSMADILNPSTFEISYWRRTDMISSGDGVARTFYQDALSEFSDKYLDYSSGRCMFNIFAWEDHNVEEIFRLGKILAITIVQTHRCLPIRLPIEFIEALSIYERASTEELEYFWKNMDPESYSKAKESLNSPNVDFTELTGYNSWREYIDSAISYDTDSNTDRHRYIAQSLAAGFLNCITVSNLDLMNLPTIDYYLSGSYKINRNKLMKQITFNCSSNVRELVENLIKNLSESQLSILLRNWTGTTQITNSPYKVSDISYQNRDVLFLTCSQNLSINPNCFESENEKQLIINTLISPVSSIHN